MTHPYATMAYAQALSHWGKPLWVPQWQTAVIMRQLPSGEVDAAGAYPFSIIANESDIAAGLAHIRAEGALSLTLVLDDFHKPDFALCAPHATLLKPFKTHYVYNRAKGAVAYDDHHKRALKKAQQQVRVDVLDLKTHGREWQALYDHLIADLQLQGLHAFPAAHYQALAEINGITAIGAWMGDELVSAHLWAGDGATQHSHLVASNAKGYEARASFAVNDFSLHYFADAQLINFGGGAGNVDDANDGLARFKRGFSNETAQSYLCGIILDEARYHALTPVKTDYFPAYRAPR